MFSKLKKGVKRVMKEIKMIVDDSFTREVYNDVKDTFYDKDKSNQIGVMIITSGLGIGLGLILKNFV